MPHLIKLARNYLFDSGFILDDQLINKDIFEELLALNCNELKIVFNLTRLHLDVKGNKRQSVKLAAQVFSNRNAKTIEFCGKRGFIKNKNWQLISNVISLFNQWFDIMNSHGKFGKHSDSRAYGVELEKQNTVLDKMDDVITKMRCPKRKALLPFQKGILLCNQSIRQLLQYLKETYSTDELSIYYIIIRRLSQDLLEKLFFLHSGHGISTRSSFSGRIAEPPQMVYIILGKHSSCVLSKSSTESDTTSTSLLV